MKNPFGNNRVEKMTLEQKAKAYDEALEIAKAWYKLDNNDLTNDDLKTLFPELAESEDEKIRKALISVLKSDFEKDTTIYGISVGDIIAWLEKQGEQKPTWTEEDSTMAFTLMRDVEQMSYISKEGKNERIGWLNSLDEKFLHQSLPEWTWKQENVEKLTEFENAMMHIGGSFFGENAGLNPNDTDAIKEQAQYLLELAQKHAWSEEDIDNLNRISLILLDASEVKQWWKVSRIIEKCEMVKLTDWLKALKQRIGGEIKLWHNI